MSQLAIPLTNHNGDDINERGRIKQKLFWLSLLIFLLLLARAVYAESQPKKQKPNETKILENIQKQIEPDHLEPFPVGEYPKTTPTTTQTIKTQPVAPVYVTAGVQDIRDTIIKWSNTYGANPTQLLRVAYCESDYRPNASNGTHFGIFQFLPSTFYANMGYMGLSGLDYWDYNDNIRVAAWMFAHYQEGQWACK